MQQQGLSLVQNVEGFALIKNMETRIGSRPPGKQPACRVAWTESEQHACHAEAMCQS